MKLHTRLTAWLLLLVLIMTIASSTAFAAETEIVSGEKTTFNMAIAYGLTSGGALLLACGYAGFVQKKNPWMLFLFISVVVVNLGYFSMSISNTLEEALLANRISYLGSVYLPLCMMMAIADLCRIRCNRFVVTSLLCVSVAVFLLAASPGYLDVYYSDVSLVFINGMAKLEKIYGPLHFVYLVYLLSYFALMVAMILTSIVKKTVTTHKHAALLLTVVFLNIAIWAVEQLVYTEFEILSVSYIVSELLLLMLYGLLQDYDMLQPPPTPAEPLPEPEAEEPAQLDMEKIQNLSLRWTQEYALTNREVQVLLALLQDKRRKEIAAELDVTEHTVKKHTGNIFSKLGVTSRAELFDLAHNN